MSKPSSNTHVIRNTYPPGDSRSPYNFDGRAAALDKKRKKSLPQAVLAAEEAKRPAMHALIVQKIALFKKISLEDAQRIYEDTSVSSFPKKLSTLILTRLALDDNAIIAFTLGISPSFSHYASSYAEPMSYPTYDYSNMYASQEAFNEAHIASLNIFEQCAQNTIAIFMAQLQAIQALQMLRL